MKRFIVAALVALSCSAAHADNKGRLIGDGKSIPREFVRGKAPLKRRDEIAMWMIDHGATYNHLCNAEENRCIDVVELPLSNGGTLRVRTNTYFDGTAPVNTYCRMTPSKDMDYCYRFEDGSYFVAIIDSVTGKWSMAWDERAPAQQQQQQNTTADIEM